MVGVAYKDSVGGQTGTPSGVTYDFYVSASDGNSSYNGLYSTFQGSTNGPKATIAQGVALLSAGKKLGVMDGTYTSFATGGAGTAGNPITIKSVNKWGAKIAGDVHTLIAVNHNWIIIENFEILNGALTTANGGTGIEIGGPTDIILRGNKIHHIGWQCTDQTYGFSGVYIESCARITIEKNVMYDIGRKRPGEEGCSPGQTYYRNHDHGIYVSVADTSSIIRNNIFYQNDNGWGVQLQADCNGTKVLNNSFDDPNPDNEGHIVNNGNLTNVDIINNASRNALGGYLIYWNSGTASGVNVKNNLIAGSSLIYRPPGSGVTSSGNVTSSDPSYVNVSTRDYHLQLGSPAIGTGLDVSSNVTDDADGLARPQGGTWDIGAYEYV